MKKLRRFFVRLIVLVIVLAIIVGAGAAAINRHVIKEGGKGLVMAFTGNNTNILENEEARLKSIRPDCIMVLGAGIRDSETPSYMLKDRLDTAIQLYKQGIAPKLLLTGDNGRYDHNEIHVMLTYARQAGVPEEDIFCDHAGFSTYDSMYRAKSIFDVSSMIIVTQSYHMYRALYIADKLHLTVLGVASDQKRYGGQVSRNLREILARDKDFFKAMIRPDSAMGGEMIPITGDGTESHGE